MDIGNWITQIQGDANLYSLVILPLIVFVSRVFDVTLGTLRIIFISRNRRALAPLVGFVEVFIWIVVIGQLVQHLHSIYSYFAYAAGFACGNFVGMWLEDKLAFGKVILRTIVSENGETLAKNIHAAGYGVTTVEGSGSNGPVKLIYTIIKRKDLPIVSALIHQSNPKAFVSIEDLRTTEEGVFPPTEDSKKYPLKRQKLK